MAPERLQELEKQTLLELVLQSVQAQPPASAPATQLPKASRPDQE
jgi:hypothetical protein